jgi:hypothetical protein
MKGYPVVPGVLDAGHTTAGYWHPGPKADCPECRPAPPLALPLPSIARPIATPGPGPEPPSLGTFIPHQGSDCPTAKRQFATRRAALGAYHSVQRNREGLAPRPYRCAWCLCFHVGNRRSNASKARGRR